MCNFNNIFYNYKQQLLRVRDDVSNHTKRIVLTVLLTGVLYSVEVI